MEIIDDFDFDDPAPWEASNFAFGRDFLLIYEEFPAEPFWESFDFDTQGVQVPADLLGTPGWSALESHIKSVRYLSIVEREGAADPDLAFLANARRLEGLATAGSGAPVDVSHLPIRYYRGRGTNLRGLFDLHSLEDVFVYGGMPDTPINSPLQKLMIRDFTGSRDLEKLSQPVSLRKLTLLDGVLDIASLARFENLESLMLSDMAHLTGVSALARLTNLRALTLIDCFDIREPDAFDDLANITIDVGGENIFDKERRRRLLDSGRADWAFPDTEGSSDGSRMFLVHPGLKKPMIAADGDLDAGPGDAVTARWERLSHSKQAERISRFASAFWEQMRQMGATTVTDIATGQSTVFSKYAMSPLANESTAQFVSILDPSGSEIGRVNENLWMGALVRSYLPPAMSAFTD